MSSGGILDGYLEAAIFKILSSDAGVLSFLTAASIAPTLLPEEVSYPAISFFRVDDPGEISLDGDDRLCHPRVQIDAWANSAREASLVGRAALLALEAMPPGVIAGSDIHFNPWTLNLQQIVKEDVRGPTWEPETRSFRVSVDVIAWFND